jgi:hypothetical protein
VLGTAQSCSAVVSEVGVKAQADRNINININININKLE